MSNESQIQELEIKYSKEISDIRHDVNAMRQELKNTMILLDESNHKRDELEKRVERLVFLLEGDSIDKDRGFISRLIALEKFTATVKDTKAYLAGNLAAAIFFITALGGLIAAFVKIYEFFKK